MVTESFVTNNVWQEYFAKIEPNYILSLLLFKMNKNLYVYDTPQKNRTEQCNITHGLKLINHNRITPTESYTNITAEQTNQFTWIKQQLINQLILMMTSAQVVEISVTITDNSPSQNNFGTINWVDNVNWPP